ncbi:putative MFS family arabinose efflux permease [Kineococcus xinjiangensis]|uniref:Putative MFS family arabinose efflux permease n=1 Tax=Kineococcus xinjiangensis TaxID=512762 RepID=A0A2S6IE28_9ACTN|nr:MFS transporter [Kineococcus xinjiangensis]PPK92461.1 putative MFS family arabinose efflux permease [Kineococcus xinjiangensis]
MAETSRVAPRALRPLRHPHYRLLAASMALSLLSAGLWTVALVWQVVALGGGPQDLSLVVSLGAFGMLLTTLLGGVLADRVPQRHILLAVAVVQAGSTGVVAALSLAQVLALWHLAAAGLLSGLAAGVYYPAYSALLPALLPEEELLAANGLEGALRPIFVQAGGPALAGVLVAAASPGAALGATALAAAASAACLLALPVTPLRRDLAAGAGTATSPVRAVLGDLAEGFRFMVRTRWLLVTLLFASGMVLAMMGPLEVLTPFAVRDRAGGGPREHALVLAAFGLGGALGSAVVASLRMPRRYLTVMTLMWGVGCVPMVVFGLSTALWPMVVAGAVAGALFNAPMVIWGTLLQRRVPPALLGRVASLDFFVSLALMPASMALAGPAAALFGMTAVFLVAGLVPLALAVVAVVAGRLPADEIAHPLDGSASPAGCAPEPLPEAAGA